MRSWIFVIGVATMGVASIIGFYFALDRAYQRMELNAETSGASSVALLKKEKQEAQYYACAVRVLPLASRCASCHARLKKASPSPFACRPNRNPPQNSYTL